MEVGTGKKVLPYILLVIFVAVFGYGLGAATVFVTNGAKANNVSANAPVDLATPTGGAQAPAGGNSTVTPPTNIDDQMKPFWNTFQAVESEFYGRPIDRQKMIYGATKGMMEALGDDYSAFLSPTEANFANSKLKGEEYAGVGAYVEKRNGVPIVAAPIPNTPAAKAGLRSKDIILAVDGRDVTKMEIDEVANLIRGPEGSTVRITLQRGDQPPFDVELVRTKIVVPVVTTEYVNDDSIAHIAVSVFGETTTKELDKALAEAAGKKVKGIILDLRDNRGGYVYSAEEMLGRFLPAGSTAFVQSLKSDHSDDRPQSVIVNGPQYLDIPLTVLVNGGSASASEIVSGALQDYGRAKLVGEQTFGKGSEQNIHDWGDGSQARITIAHWLTPKKRDINPVPTPTANPSASPSPLPTFTPTAVATVPSAAATATAGAAPLVPARTDRGLAPDYVVIRTEKDYQDDKDPQLDKAIEVINNGGK